MGEIISQLPGRVILKSHGEKKLCWVASSAKDLLATVSRVSSSLGNLNINYYISILQRFSTLKKYFITATHYRAQLSASHNCFLHLHTCLFYRLLSLTYSHFGYTPMVSNNLQVFKIVVTPAFAESYKIFKTGFKMGGERLSRCCVSEKPLSIVFLVCLSLKCRALQ